MLKKKKHYINFFVKIGDIPVIEKKLPKRVPN